GLKTCRGVQYLSSRFLLGLQEFRGSLGVHVKRQYRPGRRRSPERQWWHSELQYPDSDPGLWHRKSGAWRQARAYEFMVRLGRLCRALPAVGRKRSHGIFQIKSRERQLQLRSRRDQEHLPAAVGSGLLQRSARSDNYVARQDWRRRDRAHRSVESASERSGRQELPPGFTPLHHRSWGQVPQRTQV